VGDGDNDQDDEKPGPVANSTSDATVRDAATHASVPLRRVRAGELRWEKFLYELKAGPAGGRPRPAKPALGLDAAEAYMGLLLMKLQPYLVWLVVPSGFWRV
jgi:hypothetical protein